MKRAAFSGPDDRERVAAGDPHSGDVPERPQFYFLSALLVFLLSSAAIIAAARGDLWLDEIWSLSFARQANSVSDIFVRFKHDNNHVLNTLFLYGVGEQQPLFVYRLLAVLSGIGSVLIAGWVAKKDWGHLESLCAMFLIGTSYPLLLYFSEARGYAPAILFGVAAYATLGRNPASCQGWKVLLFWSASTLGVLAHATFVILTVAFAVWSLADEIQARAPLGQAARRLVVRHGVPLVFCGIWYVYFLKEMVVGRGPVYSTWSVIGQASVLALGLPDVTAFHWIAIVLLLVLVGWGAACLHRQGDTRWVFFPVAIVFSPALLLLVASREFLYFRYFMVCVPFLLLLLAYLVGRCFHSFPRPWRWLGFAVIAVLSVGNAPRDVLLFALGRGSYAAALEYISARSPNGIVRAGFDHDFRNRMVFDFYAPRVTKPGNLRYVVQHQWPVEPPDWIFLHSQDPYAQPPPGIVVPAVGDYQFHNEFRFAGVSGWTWFLFRRIDDGVKK
jgi:hypothetical protein